MRTADRLGGVRVGEGSTFRPMWVPVHVRQVVCGTLWIAGARNIPNVLSIDVLYYYAWGTAGFRLARRTS